ncbi:hypothetical protein GGR56DRAFT_640701 [Xylariaceae sp. FL0804]|nr:hypothetical protein GGR56DRAFT_640701 [Xylariaceae sp. FL0804]
MLGVLLGLFWLHGRTKKRCCEVCFRVPQPRPFVASNHLKQGLHCLKYRGYHRSLRQRFQHTPGWMRNLSLPAATDAACVSRNLCRSIIASLSRARRALHCYPAAISGSGTRKVSRQRIVLNAESSVQDVVVWYARGKTQGARLSACLCQLTFCTCCL